MYSVRYLQVFIGYSELNSSRLKERVEFSEGGMRARSYLLPRTSTLGIPTIMPVKMWRQRRSEEHQHGKAIILWLQNRPAVVSVSACVSEHCGSTKIFIAGSPKTFCRCDRILWYGEGIVQLSYIRGESKFSDHRPVCSAFIVEVAVPDNKLIKFASGPNMKVGVEELLFAPL